MGFRNGARNAHRSVLRSYITRDLQSFVSSGNCSTSRAEIVAVGHSYIETFRLFCFRFLVFIIVSALASFAIVSRCWNANGNYLNNFFAARSITRV